MISHQEHTLAGDPGSSYRGVPEEGTSEGARKKSQNDSERTGSIETRNHRSSHGFDQSDPTSNKNNSNAHTNSPKRLQTKKRPVLVTPTRTQQPTNTPPPKQAKNNNITMSGDESGQESHIDSNVSGDEGDDSGEEEGGQTVRIGNMDFKVEDVQKLFGNKEGVGAFLKGIEKYFKGKENKTAKMLKMVLDKTTANDGELDWLTDPQELADFVYKQLYGVIVVKKDIYLFASIVGRFKQTVHMLLQCITSTKTGSGSSSGGQAFIKNVANVIIFAAFSFTHGYDNKETKVIMTTKTGRIKKDHDEHPHMKIQRTPHYGWPTKANKKKSKSGTSKQGAIYLADLVANTKTYKERLSGDTIRIAKKYERCENMGKPEREDMTGPVVVLAIILCHALMKKKGKANAPGVGKMVLRLNKIMEGCSIYGYRQQFTEKRINPVYDSPIPSTGKGGGRFMPEIFFVAEIFCMKGHKKLSAETSKTNKRATVDRGEDGPEATGWEDVVEHLQKTPPGDVKFAEGSVAKNNFDDSLETAIFKESQYNVLLGLDDAVPRYVDFNCLRTMLSEPGENDEIPDCNLRPPAEGLPEDDDDLLTEDDDDDVAVTTVAAAPPELREQLLATAPERQNPGTTSGNPTDVVATEEGDNDGAPPRKQPRKSRNPAPRYS